MIIHPIARSTALRFNALLSRGFGVKYRVVPAITDGKQFPVVPQRLQFSECSSGFDALSASRANIERLPDNYLESVTVRKAGSVFQYPPSDSVGDLCEHCFCLVTGVEGIDRCGQIVQMSVKMWSKIATAQPYSVPHRFDRVFWLKFAKNHEFRA